MKNEAEIVGLGINSDLIVTVQPAISGVLVVDPADATLSIESIIVAIDAKTAMLKCLRRERLHYLNLS